MMLPVPYSNSPVHIHSKAHWRKALSTIALFAGAAIAVADVRYNLVPLKPAGFVAAFFINSAGHVVGENAQGHLILWDGTSTHDLGTEQGGIVTATGFNASDEIVGYVTTTASDGTNTRLPFVFSGGNFNSIQGFPAGTTIASLVVNDQGVVAGTYIQGTTAGVFRIVPGQTLQMYAPTWSYPVTGIGVTGINAAADVVGYVSNTVNPGLEQSAVTRVAGFKLVGSSFSFYGTLESGARTTAISGYLPSSIVSAVNDAGTVVGTSTTDQPSGHATFFESVGSSLIDLVPGGGGALFTRAAINNFGEVVANIRDSGGNFVPALWHAGVQLNLATLTSYGSTGYTAVAGVNDINDAGQILVTCSPGGGGSPNPDACVLMPIAGSPATIVNVSSRGIAGSGTTTSILSFVASPGASNLLVRTVGPTLANFGLSSAASDSSLTFADAIGNTVATNDDWGSGANAATVAAWTTRAGAFALAQGSKDAAIVVTTPTSAGSLLAGATDPSRTILNEIYDLSGDSGRHITNASSRSQVGTGESVGVLGFVLAGTLPRRVLMRASGPSLQQYGVGSPLPVPRLALYVGSQEVAENTGWRSKAAAPVTAKAFQTAGAFTFADNSADSALIEELEPGAYTIQVSDPNGASGVALVELYLLP